MPSSDTPSYGLIVLISALIGASISLMLRGLSHLFKRCFQPKETIFEACELLRSSTPTSTIPVECFPLMPRRRDHGEEEELEEDEADKKRSMDSETSPLMNEVSSERKKDDDWRRMKSMPGEGGPYLVIPHDEGLIVEDMPLMMVFGWGGSSIRQLRSIVTEHVERGRRVLVWIPNFLDPEALQEVVEGIATYISEALARNLLRKGLIFHVFSNNGTFAALRLVTELEKRSLTNLLHGVIFDSAPGCMSLASGTRAVVASYLGRPQYYHWFLSPAVYLSMFFSSLLFGSPDASSEVQEFQKKGGKFSCPVMYLYSRSDGLCPSRDIEHHINQMRKTDIRVFSTDFTGTPHVQHYRLRRNLYMCIVEEFIEFLNVSSSDEKDS